MMMSNWNGTILGPPHVSLLTSTTVSFSSGQFRLTCPVQSVHENRIYSLNIHCGADYPDNPPSIQFISRVNLPCVDQRTGKVYNMTSLNCQVEIVLRPLSRSIPPSCLALLSGSVNTPWKPSYLNSEGNGPHPHPSFFFPTGLVDANLSFRYMALPQHKKLPQPAEGSSF